jgi:hypothetical protein
MEDLKKMVREMQGKPVVPVEVIEREVEECPECLVPMVWNKNLRRDVCRCGWQGRIKR